MICSGLEEGWFSSKGGTRLYCSSREQAPSLPSPQDPGVSVSLRWGQLFCFRRTPQGVGLTKRDSALTFQSQLCSRESLPFSLFPSSSLYLWDPAGTCWSLKWGVLLPQEEVVPVWEQGLTKCLFPRPKAFIECLLYAGPVLSAGESYSSQYTVPALPRYPLKTDRQTQTGCKVM